MATKKAAANSNALVKWDEKFSKYAKEQKAQVANITAGGIGVSFSPGVINVGGAPVGNKLEAIIIGSCAHNKYYKEKYNPSEKTPPDCYAFSLIVDDPDMKPHAASADKQAEGCAECDFNVFGSAENGRGKACANTLRLGLLLSKDVDDAASALANDLATAGVSPTNAKYYKSYTDGLEEEHGRPVWAAVTEITCHPDPKTQIRLEFKLVELIEDVSIIEALEKRYLKVQDVLQQPYAAPTDRPAAPPVRGRGGASAKFVGKAAPAKATPPARGRGRR
jgi:hypothetical protein